MTATTAPSTCTVHGPACDRIHVGDRVAVVLDPGQLGYGATGTVIATTQYAEFIVAFDTPVSYTYGGETSVYARLPFGEEELDKLA